MPKVLNQRTDIITPGAVYVGRPSKWGNPFVIGKDGPRHEVIAKYRLHAQSAFDRNEIERDLRGKDLVCWCAPRACHADVLLELANGAPT